MPKKHKKPAARSRPSSILYPPSAHDSPNPLAGLQLHEDPPALPEHAPRNPQSHAPSSPHLIFSSPSIWLYHDNCLAVLDAVAKKYPEGRFDCIFADPPYFLSNGGITCHAGKMVKVHKGDWDQSRGPELNHEFNTEWLRRCQKVLKPNGTIWVTGTHHVIFSVG